ncbi:recombinase family protein [Microbispora bryophytorum]|uniref:recombinase family protein n=1 Tax=Microbispora bryophytorum TaxID=1460882 RepID=UPI00371F889B
MPEQSPIPVVSYARISADVRRDEHGVQDQHKLNRETAARYGWTVVHEFTDNDKSAAKADVVRDDFEAMLKVLRSGELPDSGCEASSSWLRIASLDVRVTTSAS